MTIDDISLYTIIQLVMGIVMAAGGLALFAGILLLTSEQAVAICLIAIAGKYLADGIIQLMSAMSANVEPELEIPEKIREMI